jgi:hypothetical protein
MEANLRLFLWSGCGGCAVEDGFGMELKGGKRRIVFH